MMILTVVLLFTLLTSGSVTAYKGNLALGAKAVQSSTARDSGKAQNAVDGNSNANYWNGSCTHTNYERDPWWRLELPRVYNITSVTITNRGDCCGHRIHGAQIRIGNSLRSNGNKNKLVAVINPRQLDVFSTYNFKATEGRFVNIFLPGIRKILTLCEVNVFTDEFNTQTQIGPLHENIAVGAPAVQSSTYNDLGKAQNAVDGNRETNYHRGSCTHTGIEKNPWWRVELPGVCNVTSVTITNRGDCCGERINGAQIRIGNSLKDNGNKNKLVAVIDTLETGATETYRFKATKGRFVNILIPGSEKILTLCEVKVFTDEEFSPESLYNYDNEDLQNLSLRGRATQSSLPSSGALAGFSLAQNAIDGNRNPDPRKGSCMQTAEESSPWWRVNLHKKYIIYSVALTSRGDCCPEHLTGAEIRIGDSLENYGKNNPLCAKVSSISAGQTVNLNCINLLEGRYVTIFVPGENTLSVCEVEVFGRPVERHATVM